MKSIMQNERVYSHISWLAWIGRYAILLALLGLLNFAAQGRFDEWGGHASYLRTLRMFAYSLHLLLLCAGLAMLAIQARQTIRMIKPCKSSDILATCCVFALLWFTTLPLGNYWKYGALFYEEWMWLCTLWTVNLGLAYSLGGWMLEQRPLWLMRFSDWLERRCAWACTVTRTSMDAVWLPMLALAAGILCVIFNAALFGGIPHVQDSAAQYFQAKIFANGAFAAPAPNHLPFFERIYLLAVEDRWFSIYPPGHALSLSLGFVINTPWLVNPLFAAVSILLLYSLAVRLYGYPTARLAALLWTLSPFHLFMGAEYMNHTTSLVFILLFFVALLAAEGPRRIWGMAFIAGFAFAFAAITRPYSALAFGVVAVVWMAVLQARSMQKRLRFVLFFLVGVAPVAFFNLAYNHHTTGDPFTSGYQRYFGGSPLGFGERPWGTEPLAHGVPNVVNHTPLRGLANTFNNFNALNHHLFGWPIASLAFAFFVFMPTAHRRREDWLCLIAALAMPAAYFFYFYQDYCFGPRFYYESAPFWVLLSARGIFLLATAAQRGLPAPESIIRAVLVLLIAAFFLIALMTTWVALIREYGDDYWGVRRSTVDLLRQELRDEKAIVFVEYDYDYNAVFTQLDPWLERGPLVVLDLGEETNRQIIRAYPGYSLYRLYLEPDGPAAQAKTLLAPY